MFDFDIRSDQPKKWLEISLRDDSNPANRSVTVRMTVKNPEVLNDGEVVSFMCSTGGNTFFACTYIHFVVLQVIVDLIEYCNMYMYNHSYGNILGLWYFTNG